MGGGSCRASASCGQPLKSCCRFITGTLYVAILMPFPFSIAFSCLRDGPRGGYPVFCRFGTGISPEFHSCLLCLSNLRLNIRRLIKPPSFLADHCSRNPVPKRRATRKTPPPKTWRHMKSALVTGLPAFYWPAVYPLYPLQTLPAGPPSFGLLIGIDSCRGFAIPFGCSAFSQPDHHWHLSICNPHAKPSIYFLQQLTATTRHCHSGFLKKREKLLRKPIELRNR